VKHVLESNKRTVIELLNSWHSFPEKRDYSEKVQKAFKKIGLTKEYSRDPDILRRKNKIAGN
jgi:hypothetical protein